MKYQLTSEYKAKKKFEEIKALSLTNENRFTERLLYNIPEILRHLFAYRLLFSCVNSKNYAYTKETTKLLNKKKEWLLGRCKKEELVSSHRQICNTYFDSVAKINGLRAAKDVTKGHAYIIRGSLRIASLIQIRILQLIIELYENTDEETTKEIILNENSLYNVVISNEIRRLLG